MKHFGLAVMTIAVAGAALAAVPPDLVQYQGILRDTDGAPVDGGVDMILRLWSAASGGDEILIDSHSGAGAVTATRGMFDIHLGGGVVRDGSGPGIYDALHQVFTDHSKVWLALEVEGETLAPRVRIVAVPYAANAAYLAGERSDRFLDTTSTTQSKPGKLVLGQAAGTPSAYGLEAYGFSGGAYFGDADGSSNTRVGERFWGVRAYGNTAGGYFDDSDGSGYAYAGYGDYGIRAYGTTAGGRFEGSVGSGYTIAGWGDRGVEARGSQWGGDFEDSNDSGEVRLGVNHNGLEAFGTDAGGHFVDSAGTGFAYLGKGAYGIWAYGDELGGYFEDSQSGVHARLGVGHRGIEAIGTSDAYFEDTDGSGNAYLGAGILAYGDAAAGYFENSLDGSVARIAQLTRGIEAAGSRAGGYFSNLTESGEAYLGFGGWGIGGYGDHAGGRFEDTDSGSTAWMVPGDHGLYAYGNTMGARLEDADHSGYAFVAYGDRGILAKGTFAGGTFSHPDDVTYWADVARIRDTTTYKIRGTGAVSFAQNHPEETDRLVVYAAPEGDEVAVHTRGSARLVGGEARVLLGETFSMVANPDIGLTAHLTARDEAAPLAVAGLTTSELIVRGPVGSDASFDYLVYGLRVGFEEHCPADVKDREAFLPPREAAGAFYTVNPELRRLNALERFLAMRTALGGSGESDLSRTEALIAAINANREEVVAASEPTRGEGPGRASAGAPGAGAPAFEQRTWLPVASEVEAGEVLALDPEQPGVLRPAPSAADPTVIGVASGPSRPGTENGLEAPVETSGIVELRADAGYGEIRPGDLLVASPTPGHAMRAPGAIPGTVLGRALDPLPFGTGEIRALLVMR